MYLIIVML
jgi:hypothetical protein